jgi:fatty acid desaturase
MADTHSGSGDGRLLDRDAYRRLLRKRDGVAAMLLLLRVAFHAILLTCSYRLMSDGHVLAAMLLLVPHFMAWSFLGWAGIGHELFHRSVFSARWLNVALFRLFSILTWNNFGYFEVTHPVHHRRTLGEGDFEANPQGRLSILGTFALLTVDVGAIYRRVQILALNSVGIAPGGGLAKVFPPRSAEFIQLRDGARAVLVGQGLLIATCLWLGSPFMAVAISLAPFCMTFPNRTLAALQHFNLSAGDIPGDYESSTRTVVLDPVTEFFYAGMNFHLEHHYFPAIPHYNLRRVHDAFQSGGKHQNIEKGYWNGLRLLAREGFFTSGKKAGPGSQR